MTPQKAQRVWRNLSMKWISAPSYGYPRYPRRKASKVKKGLLTNFIQVEVVNAITGEISKGYIQASSVKKLIQWLGFHNHKAEVEQVFFSKNSTFAHLDHEQLKELPILIKLSKNQFPYVITHVITTLDKRNKIVHTLKLNTVDNLKYLETVARRKPEIIKVFNKIKRQLKRKRTLSKKKR